MKYFSPSFSYMIPPGPGSDVRRQGTYDKKPCDRGPGGRCYQQNRLAHGPQGLTGGEVEPDVLGRVLGVREHDRPVVLVDHAAVVGRHVLLELGRVEEAGFFAEGLGDLVV